MKQRTFLLTFLLAIIGLLLSQLPAQSQTSGQYYVPQYDGSGFVERYWTPSSTDLLGWNGSGVLANVPQSTFAAASHNQAWSTITSTPTTLSGYGITDAITAAAVAAGYQPLDSDLTSIAALTTTSYGRALLTESSASTLKSALSISTTDITGINDYLTTATAASTYQPLDSDLTSIAALTTTSFGRSLLTETNAASVKSTLSLGNVENTALSTWAGSTNITTLGTLSAGAVPASLLTGTIATARLGSGTADSTTYLRGDSTWQTISSSGATLGANTFTDTQTITPSAANTGALTVSGFSNTGSNTTPMISLSGTWNTSGTTPAAVRLTMAHTSATEPRFVEFVRDSTALLWTGVATHWGMSNAGIIGGGGNGIIIAHNNRIVIGRTDGGWAVTAMYNGTCVGSDSMLGFNGFASSQNAPSGISTLDAFFMRDASGVIQMGADHATTATAQAIKAHDVTTGTGGGMSLIGGKGSSAGGTASLATSATNGTPRAVVTARADGELELPVATVESASDPASTHKITIYIGGTRYKVLAIQE